MTVLFCTVFLLRGCYSELRNQRSTAFYCKMRETSRLFILISAYVGHVYSQSRGRGRRKFSGVPPQTPTSFVPPPIKIPGGATGIILIDKENKLTKIIDVAISGDARVVEKEREKIDKYRPLRDEITRLWSMREVEIIPVVVGALGAVSKQFEVYVEAIGIKMNIEHTQKKQPC